MKALFICLIPFFTLAIFIPERGLGADPDSERGVLSQVADSLNPLAIIPISADPTNVTLGNVIAQHPATPRQRASEKLLRDGPSDRAYDSNVVESQVKKQLESFKEKHSDGDENLFKKFPFVEKDIPTKDENPAVFLKNRASPVTAADLKTWGNQLNVIVHPVIQSSFPDTNPENHKVTALDVEFFHFYSPDGKLSKITVRVIADQPIDVGKELVKMMKAIKAKKDLQTKDVPSRPSASPSSGSAAADGKK